MSSATHSTKVIEPNAELAGALVELAMFLAAHPELPPVTAVAWISAYRSGARDGRADLTALARALGDRAIEKQAGDRVRVGAHFGPVELYAEATVQELRDEPPAPPPYEPIIPPPLDRDDDKPLTEAQMFEASGVPYGLAVKADELARKRRLPHQLREDATGRWPR